MQDAATCGELPQSADRKQAAQARAAEKEVQKSVEKSSESGTIKEKISIQ